MATLPICDELCISVNSPDWEPMFILRCQREITEDLRLAREINALCARVTAIVDERDNFVDELDILVGRSVPDKMAEFIKQTQGKDILNLMKLQILGREFEFRAREKGHFHQEVEGEHGLLIVVDWCDKTALLEDCEERGLFVGFYFVVSPASLILIGCAVVVGLVGGVAIFQEEEDVVSGEKKVRGAIPKESLMWPLNFVGRRYLKKGPVMIVASAVNLMACDQMAGPSFQGGYLLEVFDLYFSSGALSSVRISKRESACSELREAIRMRDEYMNELQMLGSSEELLEGIEIMRCMQFDDMEKASRLLLMAREIQTKVHEKNSFIRKLRL
ncbi:hypothetical protein Tco_0490398 [Tanacetum coccineum]